MADGLLGTTLLRTSYLLQMSMINGLSEPSVIVDLVLDFVTTAKEMITSFNIWPPPTINFLGPPTTTEAQMGGRAAQTLGPTLQADVVSNIEPLARLFKLLVKSLQDTAISNILQPKDLSRLTQAIFSFFQHLLEQIISLAHKNDASSPPPATKAAQKAPRRINGRFARSAQATSRPSPTSKIISNHAKTPKDPNILLLANLFIYMLSSVASADVAANKGIAWSTIVEAAISLIIQRIASLLSLFVFGISAPILPFAAPVQIPLLKGNEEARKAQEHEAIWLLCLLERSLPFMSARSDSMTGDSPKRQRDEEATRRTDNAQPMRKGIHAVVKKKLQNTLLTAIFGTSIPNIEEILTSKVDLDAPVDIPSPPNQNTAYGSKSVEGDYGSWFVGEVWRIVGWRLLQGWD